MKYINGVNRKQVILFPEIIDEYVEANNPVRFIDAFV
jgi:transposase